MKPIKVRYVDVTGMTDEEAEIAVRKADRMNKIKTYSARALGGLATVGVIVGISLFAQNASRDNTIEEEGDDFEMTEEYYQEADEVEETTEAEG